MRIRIRVPQVLVVVAVLAFGVVGVLALVGAISSGGVRRGAVGLALLVSLSGVASALWQQFVAAKSQSCDLTLAERIVTGLHLDRLAPDLFIAYASCADAAVNLIGVPFAIWSCAMYLILAGLLFWTLRSSMRVAASR